MIKIIYEYDLQCFGCSLRYEVHTPEVSEKYLCPRCGYDISYILGSGPEAIKTVIEDDGIEEIEPEVPEEETETTEETTPEAEETTEPQD